MCEEIPMMNGRERNILHVREYQVPENGDDDHIPLNWIIGANSS